MALADTIIGSIRRILVPIRPEAFPYVGILVFVAFFFGWFWQPVFWLGLILAALCAYFFRDPHRVTPPGEGPGDGLVTSPADGHIASVSLSVAPRSLDLGEQLRRRVSISMSVLDSHVSRAPIGGTAIRVLRHRRSTGGQEAPAEREAIVVMSSHGPVAVTQVAGVGIPRAISFVVEGASVGRGDRVGLISLGSRVDIYLPVQAVVQVSEGQTAVAGETVLARFDGPEDARRGRAPGEPG